jgi:hypothetical protein
VQRRLALVLAALVLLAGCSGPSGPKPRDYSEPGWQEATLQPGWTLDLEYVLSSGQKLRWDWATDDGRILHFQAIAFDERGQSRSLYIGQAYLNESVGELTVPKGGRYDLTWLNEGRVAVTVHYRVSEGHLPPKLWPPGEGPGCPPTTGGLLAC